ncbi:ABC transporter permease [Bacillus altitudinis]|jgi:putative ABC transport system permease protein|uniref:ABC transporter permease n=1 Tax=Bacillus TaxID=1386 RepID=UPI0004092DE5|nr:MULTISPECIES: ABC transporter permease [Bacillus]AMM88757.1 macrolide ABC transporter permease [Bacillus pumilus]MBX7001314.1 FtsX-like permease family protein [Bacillus aerophilus]ATH72005.1 FtsX-like permease family protein [Bacillus altitudinis]MBR0628296.1 FtsX-like permease family protein [Bacillus altitudinis S70-5-12]MBX7014345.1 FtsX-like permease family protein [Bacillus aerophilus]
MKLFENIKIALNSVLAHKLRSILTMLGIIIGVGSVIAVVAIGQGGEQMLKESISGPNNTIDMTYTPSDEELNANPNALFEATFTEEDIQSVQALNGVKQVASSTAQGMQLRFQDTTIDATVNGINEGYTNVHSLHIAEGQDLREIDFRSGRRAAVISEGIQKELFNGEKAVGELIWMNGQPVEVIGVLAKQEGLFSFDMNEIYVPFAMLTTAFGVKEYDKLSIQVAHADQMKEVGKSAAARLNENHHTDDAYEMINLEEIAAGIGQITSVMTTIIGSIAGISLLVGGIGVMNIMLVSVTERTREIGIRKALGATRAQILVQFLIESVVLTLIGGLLGIALGLGGASLVSLFAGWPSLVSWQIVCGGVLFSMLIGIIFGLIPANKAARLDPIESLRYE